MQIVRYLVVLVTGYIAGNRLLGAAQAWREWHTWASQDPSGAGPYRTFFLANSATALLSLCIAGLVWWLLRPGQRSRSLGR